MIFGRRYGLIFHDSSFFTVMTCLFISIKKDVAQQIKNPKLLTPWVFLILNHVCDKDQICSFVLSKTTDLIKLKKQPRPLKKPLFPKGKAGGAGSRTPKGEITGCRAIRDQRKACLLFGTI